MIGALRPLTEEEMADFDKRRESGAVIQYRCTCGTWYETPKGNVANVERFNCAVCGADVAYPVPALDGIRPLTNEERLELIGSGGVLDSGMTAKEAIARASAWWNSIGRHGMAESRFASKDPDDPRFLASGILNGHTWAMLGKREQIMVVKAHHHFTIRKPDLLDEDPAARHNMQDRNSIN
jgi:hypothetical protein